jgi:hypothetical protein
MRYPLVRDLAADGVPVAVTCRVLSFSKQAFYQWCQDPAPQRDWDETHLINAALDIHRDGPAFGYRFIADELPARGITASENRVARLCSQQRIWSAVSKKRGLGRKAGPPVHDDLVGRQFTAEGPDRTWLTDITEHPTAEGKLYLCAVKDVYSNRIVGYSMDGRMTAQLAVSALRNAIALRSPAGTVVVHSGRGPPSTPPSPSPSGSPLPGCASVGTAGDAYDKACVSHCTSWRGLGSKSVSDGASLAGDQPWVAGCGRLEEPDVLVVGLVRDEQPGAVPVLDR